MRPLNHVLFASDHEYWLLERVSHFGRDHHVVEFERWPLVAVPIIVPIIGLASESNYWIKRIQFIFNLRFKPHRRQITKHGKLTFDQVANRKQKIPFAFQSMPFHLASENQAEEPHPHLHTWMECSVDPLDWNCVQELSKIYKLNRLHSLQQKSLRNKNNSMF